MCEKGIILRGELAQKVAHLWVIALIPIFKPLSQTQQTVFGGLGRHAKNHIQINDGINSVVKNFESVTWANNDIAWNGTCKGHNKSKNEEEWTQRNHFVCVHAYL